MSQNARVILVLLLLIGGVGLIAYFATRDSTLVPEGPRDRGEEDAVVVAPPVPLGRPGVLTGEVRVFKTGEPAAEIEVRIEGAGDPITRKTNARGVFAASVPSGPPVTVTVVAPPPYADVVISGVTIESEQTTSLGTLYLERALLVRGIVVTRTGSPVVGAEVKAFRPVIDDAPAVDFLEAFMNMTKPRPSIDDAVTDDAGTFVLRKLSPGTYRIEAQAEGFAVGAVAKAVVSPGSERVEHRIVLGPGHRLEGSVTTANAIPVEGALVSVVRFGMGRGQGFEFSPVQTVTDDEGMFRFANLTPGQAQIAVRAKGYPTKMQNTVNIGQQATVKIVLGGTATMRGRIISGNGEPVAGASISVAVGQRGGAFGEAESDADGRYHLPHMPEGRLMFLRVEAVGYVTFPVVNNPMMFARGFGELKAGEVLTKDIILSSGARVFGRITGESDGQPIGGATVYLLSGVSAFLGAAGQAVTNDDGDYEVKGIGKGLYQVVVKASGYYQTGIDPMFMQRAFGFGGGSGAKEGGPEVKLADGGPDQRLDIGLMRGAIAIGTVVAPDDTPVPGARVTVVAAPAQGGMFLPGRGAARGPTAISDENGRFVLSGLEAGDAVMLEAEAEAWVRGESEAVRLQSGQETAGIVVRLRAGGRLSGTITSYLGSPLAGAEVRVMAQPENATEMSFQWEWQLRSVEPVLTDEQGRFQVESLTPGAHILSVGAKGHRTVTKLDVMVPEGADGGPIDRKLEKGLQISGVIVDPEGKAIAGVNLWTSRQQTGGRGMRSAGGFQNVTTEEDGTFVLESLDPGSYTLTINSQEYANQSVSDVAAGTADLRIVLEKGKSISGRVLLPDGSPAANTWVTAQSGSSANGSDRTDEDGNFTIENLPDGEYTVRANTMGSFGFGGGGDEGPSLLPAVLEGVAAGSRNLELRLRAGAAVDGTVTDDAGNPVVGAGVMAMSPGPDSSNGWAQTDENGRFRVTGLEPGRRYTVTANHGDYGTPESQDVNSDATGLTIVMLPKPEPTTEPDQPRTVPERPR